MNPRFKTALIGMWLMYALSFVLPTVHFGSFEVQVELSGWEVFVGAVQMMWGIEEWQNIIPVLQMLTNVPVLVSPFVWVVRFRKVRRYLPTLMLLATLINISALVFYHSLEIFRLGFYLWIVTFPMMTIVLYRLRRHEGNVSFPT